MTSNASSFTSTDWDNMQSIFDYQEEYMDELAFLEESYRVCTPEYDDIGCYVHQDGEAMVWDFEHSVYIPYGPRTSKWPHPMDDFPAPIITNTDLPEKYMSCSIVDCVNLVEHIVVEGENYTRTDSDSLLTLELKEEYTPNLDWADSNTPTPGARVITHLSESDLENIEYCKKSEKIDKSEKSEKMETDAIVSFIKNSYKTGETQFYVATFSNGETCYIPGYISKNKLNLGDKISVTAFATEGHGNQWRASYIKNTNNMEITIKCEGTEGNWGFLIGCGGSTLKEMAKASTYTTHLPPPTIIITPEDNSTATIVVKSNHKHTDFDKLKDNIFKRGEDYGYVIHFK
jgi:hypothetical protein